MGTGRLEAKGKSPMVSSKPTLNVDTRPLNTIGSRQSYGTIGERQSIEVDDDDLEAMLEEEGLYLGSYTHLVRTYAIVPVTSLLAWLLFALIPLLADQSPPTPHVPYFPTPVPELLLSSSLFTLSHILHPYLFTLADWLLPHPTATSALGTALHVILRNALRTAAFPMLALATPSGFATFRAPAFRRVWWLALGWSLAEVTAGIAQGYETLALYRDVLVPEGDARQLVAEVVAAATVPRKNGGSDNSSPQAADERLRESLSRGEEGGPAGEAAGSPVSGRQQKQQQASCRSSWMEAANDVEIQIEVDKDFDALVAVKARDEVEELYGCPAICIPVFVFCVLRIASILLSLGIVLLLSAGYLTAPLSSPPTAEYAVMTTTIPPCWTNSAFWGIFFGVCGVNWGLSMLHTPVFLPRVGMHVVAYLGFLLGLGMLFTGLSVWDALS